MTSGKTISARQVAFIVLGKFQISRGDSADILHKFIERTDRKAQANDLVFGVIRNRRTIDMLITKTAELPEKRINKKLFNILRIAAYELFYAPKTADFAIVNEAVNLTHTVAGKKQAGFVNAVLRKMTKNIASRNADLIGANARKILPHSPKKGCLFKDIISPDPKAAPAAHLAAAFSMPDWLIENFLNEFGFEQTRQICFASNRRPSVFLRPNTLKISKEKLQQLLTAEQIKFEILKSSSMIKLKSHQPVTTLAGFGQGLFTVQDPTASIAAQTLAPKPEWAVLDLCAAPGTKTMQLAQLMNDTGRIIATDINKNRLKKVNENCDRLDITIVETIQYEDLPRIISQSPAFNAVLVDAPCSNTGVLARRPEVRSRINPQAIKTLMDKQSKLLKKAASVLSIGGKICYSTCSILKQENTEVIKRFLANNPNFQLLHEKLTMPSVESDLSFDCDGGYVAVIKKQLN